MIPLVYRRPQEPTLHGTSLFIWRLKGKCRASCRTEENWAGGRIRLLHALIWPTRGQIWPAPHSQHKIICLYGAIQLFNLPGEHLHNVVFAQPDFSWLSRWLLRVISKHEPTFVSWTCRVWNQTLVRTHSKSSILSGIAFTPLLWCYNFHLLCACAARLATC